MKNAVFYKNAWLMKNSKAYELYQAGEYEKLDKHLKQLDLNERELLKKYAVSN